MATMKIKKDDMVQVIAGKDKGKEGKVLSVDAKNNKAKHICCSCHNHRLFQLYSITDACK